ncbi:MAG: glycosyltransferase family 2 protein [Pseudomonadales bacterium]|nr:glycosyltransferase family 2 protein [Pseudomonadales bacterium]
MLDDLEITAVIPTIGSRPSISRTIDALLKQSVPPIEIIVVVPPDRQLVALSEEQQINIKLLASSETGAAAQRNLGASSVESSLVLFIDDDILLEESALEQFRDLFIRNREAVAVSGIMSDAGATPSNRAALWYRFLAGRDLESYGGKVIGPAYNLYVPTDVVDEEVGVEWLNSGCVCYRTRVFDRLRFNEVFFKQYSYMEDVDLSVRASRWGELFVLTSVRIDHVGTAPGDLQLFQRTAMGVINRYYVMTRTMGRKSVSYLLKFILLNAFNIVSRSFRIRTASDFVNWLAVTLGVLWGTIQLPFKLKGHKGP